MRLKGGILNVVLLGLQRVADLIIDNRSFKVELGYLWLHFDELIVAHDAVDEVAEPFVAPGRQEHEPRQVFITDLLHADIGQLEANLIALEGILGLAGHPVGLGLEHLEHLNFAEVFAYIMVLLQVEADHHHEIDRVGVLATQLNLLAFLLELHQVGGWNLRECDFS